MMRVGYSELETWCAAILESAGVGVLHAKQTASTLLRTDARGIKTHGITRLASYLEKIKRQEVNAQPQVVLDDSNPVNTIVQADGALGQVAMQYALSAGLKQLKNKSMVMVQVRECGHLGALGLYAREAAEAGAFCLLMQRTPPLIALEGFDAPAVGNNPLAYAFPVAGQAPVVFDMACSVAARGHILLKARQDEPIPEGWALDAAGEPTTNAHEALLGALLPSAGHKGLGLAMLVECLAGGLTATESSTQALSEFTSVPVKGAQGRQNAFMLLLNPDALSLGHFSDYMKTWAQTFQRLGGDNARLPGSRGDELERCIQQTGSLELDSALYAELTEIGLKAKIPVPKAMDFECKPA